MSDQAAMFEPTDLHPLRPWHRSGLIAADPSIDSAGVSHFGQGDDTEAAAARLITPRTGGDRMLVLATLAGSEGPLTDYEIAQLTGLRQYTAAPRRGDLLRGGWVEDSGERHPTDSGTPATAWRLSERGREAWNRMEVTR